MTVGEPTTQKQLLTVTVSTNGRSDAAVVMMMRDRSAVLARQPTVCAFVESFVLASKIPPPPNVTMYFQLFYNSQKNAVTGTEKPSCKVMLQLAASSGPKNTRSLQLPSDCD
jgi:hypothetical protein